MVETTTQFQRSPGGVLVPPRRIAWTTAEVSERLFGPSDEGESMKARRRRITRLSQSGRLPVVQFAANSWMFLLDDLERFLHRDPASYGLTGIDTMNNGLPRKQLLGVGDLTRVFPMSRHWWYRQAKLGSAHGGIDAAPRGACANVYFKRDDVVGFFLARRQPSRWEV
jgi:hypothetical protein